ncbi:kinesin-like KIF20B [Crotalus adamanteus]|uniref:Kinesin-like KIF20B n=1 Tax=Crotalus adamanteus TaxID=8729 RepID=A0AAW1BF75_CROAD
MAYKVQKPAENSGKYRHVRVSGGVGTATALSKSRLKVGRTEPPAQFLDSILFYRRSLQQIWKMAANLDKPTVSRPSFLSAVELSPRTGPVDASDVKKNLYGDFSSSFNISRRESLESKERIHVCLRVRPILELEKEHDVQGCVSVVDSTSVVLKAPKGSKTFRLSEKNLRQLVQKFTFSQVFGPKTTQEELFDGALKHPMLDFLRGHSRLIFTYGVTNAGKTHTYRGTDEDKGILPRALDMLFKSIQNKLYPDMNLKPHRCKDHRNLSKEEVREEISLKNSLLHLLKEVDYHSNSNRTTDNCEDMKEPEKEADQSNLEEQRNVKFSVWVSFCEIYNECIYDLLLPISIDKRRKMLRLAQDIKGYSYVKDLQWVQVSNSKEAYKLVKLGLRHQSYASTKLNANSSRSHSIFTVKMLKIDSETTRVMQVNELFLCDLAGSERYTRTCNEGERLKESGNINTSLLILGKCINALKINQQTKLQQHIPFRESKLTHFFQGFFNGKGKVCMIVNVSQSPSAYDETLNVLKFSAIAQKVMVLDPESPQEERVDQLSLKADSEMTLDDGVCLPMKRATIFWEGTLEDVMEDEEELVEDDSEEHQGHCLAEDPHAKEADATDEMENQLEGEDSDIIIRKEEYQKLLDIIEELKNKLIDEKKAKLYMELKIREEVTQECLQYFNAKESDLKKIFSYKEEIMETTCEERMSIYKELVKDCIALPDGKAGAEETLKKDEKVGGGEDGEPGRVADLPSMVGSLQQNVADIKKQAEMAFGVLDALEEPQLTIERLEKQLTDITAELAQAHEDLLSQNKAVMQEDKLSKSAKVLQDVTEKMALQNKHIQELSQAVQQKDKEISQLQALVGHLEASIKDSEIASVTMKQENGSESKEEGVASRRKRYLERDEEGPPSKQGFIHSSSKDSIDSEKADETRPHPSKEKGDMVTLEEKNKMLEAQVALLREKLDMEEKLSISEAKIGKFMDQESLLKVEVVDLKRLNEVERKKREESKQVTKQLKEQLLKSTDLSSRLQAEIQQKDEEYADLKEKLADTKKQIEQVQKQVSTMRAEEKLLRSKVNELEKTKGQLTEELDLKQRTIQQFKKDDLSKKLEDLSQQYQKSCEDVRCKEKIIEDMRLTLEEQEQTQSEQEQMLQATLEENEKCKAELKEWDKRYHELKEQKNDLRSQDINGGHEKNTNLLHEQLKQSQEKLEECKELHETDRRKWLAEKTLLITQAKEAETLRNKEIKKFAGDKEYYAKQLTEAEKLVAEKDHDLQRWRVERDKLVAALEIQLSSLISSNVQKDKEIEELKKMILKSSGKEHKTIPEGLRDDDSKELIEIGCKNVVTAVLTISNGAEKTQVEESSNSKQVQQHALSSCDKNDPMPGPQMWDPSFADRCSLAASSQPETVISEHAARLRILKEKQANLSNCNTTGNGSLLQQSSKVSSGDNILDQPDAVLDSYEVSSESEQISRFPKPEMEIQFSPLQPNKMEVKHQGSPSTVTLKVPRTRKRKSCTMDEDSLENENEKNVKLPANMNVWSDSLRRQGKKTAPPNPSVRKNYSLRNKHASNIKSTASPGGTLQKFGNLLQNSPTIIQTKAKKLMATIKSPKSTDEETVTKNDDKPKKAKRKLHSVNISNPVEFSGHVIVEDQKESDHEIIKRRLRMKKK